MEQKNLYTAIGRLERETNGCGRSCPVIRLGGQPYMVDIDRKSTRLNSSHMPKSRMPSSA